MDLFKLFIFCMLLSITTKSYSQSIVPSTDSIYCPGSSVNFTVTFPGIVQSASILPANVTSTLPQVTPPHIVQINGLSKVNFGVKFADLLTFNGQAFKIQYLYQNTSEFLLTSPYTFLKIKTLNNIIQPFLLSDPLNIHYNKIDTFSIHFENGYYLSEPTETGSSIPIDTILDYDFKVPANWHVNGQLSSNNWIRGNNSAIIISDGIHGNNETVAIRSVNPCNGTYKNVAEIPISFKKLDLLVDRYVCSDSAYVTIPNFPTNSSSIWRCDDSDYNGLTKINDSTARLIKKPNKTIQIYAIINGPFGVDTTNIKSVTFRNRILNAGAAFTSGSTTKILSVCNTLSDEFQSGHFRGYVEITDPTIIHASLYHQNDGQSHPSIITELIPNKKFEIQLHPGNTYETLILSLSNGCSTKLFYPIFRTPGATLCLDTTLSINSESMNFAISPNPSHGDIYIHNYNKTKIRAVEIYNSLGYQAFKKNYDSNSDIINLNIKNLKKGIYYILIRTNTSIERKKILID